ncbi:MAG: NACHT domain-containing protein [Thainema sp.]
MTQPSPKPSLEERLTDAVFKLVVAGSGGYALYNLYLEDIPKAAISGLVAFGFGLATNFGQGLMNALSSRMKQRGEASGKFIDQQIDQTVDKTLTRLTGFHRQYLEALKTHCHNLRVEGYKGRLPRLVLEEVYVPLRVHSGTTRNVSLQRGSLAIWDLLPKIHHADQKFPERLLAVIADPGFGKTTLMRFLTLSFSNQSHLEHNAKELIPILLLFREFYPRIQSATQPTLSQLIVDEVQKLPRCTELRTSEPWFRDQLMPGKCLVMLDGLDEVPEAQREQVSQWANWQMQNYPSQFILTSRPHGYNSDLFEGVQRIDILDFNNDQKRQFIHQWYRFITWEFTWRRHLEDSRAQTEPKKHLSAEQVRAESDAEAKAAAANLNRQLFADRSLIDLAKNPLLITIIAATHEASEQLPNRRVHLYREIFKLLLEYRPNRRETRLTIPNAEDNQLILQKLALELTESGKTQFSPQQGADWIAQRLAEVYPKEAFTAKQFLQEIQQVSGLLAGGEGYLYEFTHKTFQEYLTAVELGGSRVGFSKVMEHFADENWEEVVYFFVTLGDLERATKFIEKALEKPINTYTLELALRLANENALVDAELKQRLLDALQEQEPESVEVRLEQRFQTLTKLSETTAISDFITWGDYLLFMTSQLNGHFHSQAAIYSMQTSQEIEPVTDIIWEDARWFCAWLSTQPNLAPDGGVYDYRLPTVEELEELAKLSHAVGANGHSPLPNIESPLQPWTTTPNRLGNALRVVRPGLFHSKQVA